MSIELVERLRGRAESYRMGGPSSEHTAALLDETAARIEALEAENARLREALEPFFKESKIWAGYDDAEVLCEGFPNGPPSLINVGHLRAARRAREGGNADG